MRVLHMKRTVRNPTKDGSKPTCESQQRRPRRVQGRALPHGKSSHGRTLGEPPGDPPTFVLAVRAQEDRGAEAKANAPPTVTPKPRRVGRGQRRWLLGAVVSGGGGPRGFGACREDQPVNLHLLGGTLSSLVPECHLRRGPGGRGNRREAGRELVQSTPTPDGGQGQGQGRPGGAPLGREGGVPEPRCDRKAQKPTQPGQRSTSSASHQTLIFPPPGICSRSLILFYFIFFLYY